MLHWMVPLILVAVGSRSYLQVLLYHCCCTQFTFPQILIFVFVSFKDAFSKGELNNG
jgi:hypothetical protein